MTPQQLDFFKDLLTTMLMVHKKQQKELFAYVCVFNTFKRLHPQYAGLLDDSLATARSSPVLEDSGLAQFEQVLERFFQRLPESLSDSEIATIREVLSQMKALN